MPHKAILWGMNVRIPPSLKWLLNKRARLLSAIEIAEQQHSKRECMRAQMLEAHKRQEKVSGINLNASKAHLEALKRDLSAVDITLSMHETPINPEIIEPIKTQTSARKFKYGAITRLIFTCLKYANNDSRTTTEVAAFVAEYYKVDIEKAEFLQIRMSVKYRLRHLADKGKVKRTNKVSQNVEAHWQLSDWVALDRSDLK